MQVMRFKYFTDADDFEVGLMEKLQMDYENFQANYNVMYGSDITGQCGVGHTRMHAVGGHEVEVLIHVHRPQLVESIIFKKNSCKLPSFNVGICTGPQSQF